MSEIRDAVVPAFGPTGGTATLLLAYRLTIAVRR
jgi:hypothetical protein